MNWESSGMIGFDLERLLQGQMRIAKLKNAYNTLIIGPELWPLLQVQTMVHSLWGVVFPVDTNLHRFSDA